MSVGVHEPSIHGTIHVPCDTEQAFEVFAEGFATWWPRENTWSKDDLDFAAIEPRRGGRWYERARDGRELLWGRVGEWQPPGRLVLTWQIDPAWRPEPDPARASEVDVRFFAEGPEATRVELEHRHLERHGPGGAQLRAVMASEGGWPLFLSRYAEAAARAEKA